MSMEDEAREWAEIKEADLNSIMNDLGYTEFEFGDPVRRMMRAMLFEYEMAHYHHIERPQS